jgi:hypothetical protein
VAIKHLKINGAEYRGWQRQVDALSPQYRVLALSQRYFPPNKWPDDGAGWGPVNHVADLTVLLRQLGLWSATPRRVALFDMVLGLAFSAPGERLNN